MIVAKLTPYDIDRQQGVLDVHQPTLLKLAHDEKDQEPLSVCVACNTRHGTPSGT